jgi:hypothetical protein
MRLILNFQWRGTPVKTFGRSVARMGRATYSTTTGLALVAVVSLGSSTAQAAPVLQAHPAVGPNLTDLGGWNQPGYYSTLQTADVNGDGQNEIVARGKTACMSGS